jgi:hypothetical protein
MAEILQYKCVKNDSKPWLFSDHPVAEEWVAAQLANRVLVNEARKLCDSVEITDTQVVFSKLCEDDVAKSKFILGVAMLEIDNKFAVDQFEVYHDSHTTTFSYSQREV